MGRRRKLRVAHQAVLRTYSTSAGGGRMWHQVLDGLDPLVDLLEMEPSERRRRGPDVWLNDGHRGPLPATQPVVSELHEAAWHLADTRASFDPAFVARYERSSALAAAQAATIVTLSHSSRRQIVDCYDRAPDDVVVIPPGVDRRLFNPAAARPGAPLHPGDDDPGRPYVLFVSQLHPRKNLGALREAFAGLLADGFEHRLVIVGRPPPGAVADAPVPTLTAAVPGHPGSVVWLHHLAAADLARVVAGAAVFCLPSLMEGFGLTVVEAMASGVPVVVSDRGALPDVVGDAGLVVPPDAEHLRAALSRLLADDAAARHLGRRGRERSAEFDLAQVPRRWVDVLTRTLVG